MYSLTRSEAVAAVRRNIDEQKMSDASMFGAMFGSDSSDNEALDRMIASILPDAINEVSLSAPAAMLEGVGLRSKYDASDSEKGSDYADVSVPKDGRVISFSVKGPLLRLVKMRAADSGVVLTDFVSDASPEGRMQLDGNVCGTYDRPVLVRLHGTGTAPGFRYYSMKDAAAAEFSLAGYLASAQDNFPIAEFEYVPLLEYSETATEYQVSRLLKLPVLYHLTGLVMSAYNDTERAGTYLQKAADLLK